uniref:Uncharacterized protein n=1 Tax=Aegilops tauschii subsp. strangulata TaxID=200361 RepID=A0A453SRV0_AEGTS
MDLLDLSGPVTNFNEVVLHFIECMHVHMENTQTKMQGQLPPAVQTNAYTHVPYSGGVREQQVHFTPQVNQWQLPPAVRTNASTYGPFTGGAREHQVHFTPQVNHGQFPPPRVQTNTSTHGPFSGGVRDHQVQLAPRPQINQLTQALVDNSMICKEWFWKFCKHLISYPLKMAYMLMKWLEELERQKQTSWRSSTYSLTQGSSVGPLMTIMSSLCVMVDQHSYLQN